MISKPQLQYLIHLRKQIHKNPELSGYEYKTRELLCKYLKEINPDTEIQHMGQTGFVAIYDSKKAGKTVMIRCDIDALPIQEKGNHEHCSVNNKIAHVCGHDGHMTIAVGVAMTLKANPPEKGIVMLLFQPAEETGQGAVEMLNNSKFRTLKPDYIFGLHNLPGYDNNQIVISDNYFTSASIGLIIGLNGTTSHASEPENGLSPALSMSEIVRELTLLKEYKNYPEGTFATVIHARLGEIAFGTSPGYAEIMTTLRSGDAGHYKEIKYVAKNIVESIARKYKLSYKLKWVEEFAAVKNNHECVQKIVEAANSLKLKTTYIKKPFRWSEDFGFFTEHYKSGFFGLGAGINQPALHNPDYDFPDEIIPAGINMFVNIIKNTL